MSQISSLFGNPFGIGAAVEEYENVITFGIAAQLKWWGAYYSSAAADPTNSGSTWRLRSGLVMGVIAASGQWTNYSPTATDGSQVARGINAYNLRMQDVLSGSNTNKFFALIIGGNVKAANLIGLDGQARAQMADNFTFDDQVQVGGYNQFPVKNFVTKTANYTVVAADNGTDFNTLGAGAEVDFTLPAIANGLSFTFYNLADQIMKVISAEGTNMEVLNNLSATSVAFQTGSQKIGGAVLVYSNPAANKWVVRNISAGAATITVA